MSLVLLDYDKTKLDPSASGPGFRRGQNSQHSKYIKGFQFCALLLSVSHSANDHKSLQRKYPCLRCWPARNFVHSDLDVRWLVSGSPAEADGQNSGPVAGTGTVCNLQSELPCPGIWQLRRRR